MRNISFFTLLEIALRHILIIIVAAMITGIGGFCFCEFVAVPQYSATGSIMVTNASIVSDDDNEYYGDNINSADISASLSFANTVTDILTTNGIYKNLSDELGGRYTYTQLKGLSNISRRNTNTLFIDISFTANSREEAIELVNTYLEIAPNYINTFVPKTAVTATSIADTAGKIYPRTVIATGISGMFGALIAYAILFVVYCSNTVIKGEDDFKDKFDIPVLGCIPDFSSSKQDKYYKKYNYGKGGKTENGK